MWTFHSFGWLVGLLVFFNCLQSTCKIFCFSKPHIRRMIEISATFIKIIFLVEEWGNRKNIHLKNTKRAVVRSRKYKKCNQINFETLTPYKSVIWLMSLFTFHFHFYFFMVAFDDALSVHISSYTSPSCSMYAWLKKHFCLKKMYIN